MNRNVFATKPGWRTPHPQTFRVLLIILFITRYPLSKTEAQTFEPLPFGDMENWIVREIKESAIIGGETKLLYELGPTDTIRANTAFQNQGGSPWANSNVMAKVAGVVKTNTSVYPEKRENGWCVRMETHYERVRVLGLIDIEVIAAGSVYLGAMHEPIRGTKNPQSKLQSGIPFSRRPSAVRFDYKIKASPQPDRIRSTGFSRKQTIAGQDSLAVILFLQNRWEDENGNVFARRIGSMVKRFVETTPDWVNNAEFPILYGDISSHPSFEPFMRIQVEERYTLNSKGKSVPIQELGWADPDEQPTHIILQFTSSHGGAYIGSPGNTLWIDNAGLVY